MSDPLDKGELNMEFRHMGMRDAVWMDYEGVVHVDHEWDLLDPNKPCVNCGAKMSGRS